MKNLVLIIINFFISTAAFTQQSGKPIIDSAAVVNWPSLGNEVAINSNGNYFFYIIDNQPAGSRTLVVQATKESWKKEYVNIGAHLFSKDGSQFIFQNHDNLESLKLGTGEVKTIINNVEYFRSSDDGLWLSCQLKNEHKELVLVNLSNGKAARFSNVAANSFDKSGNALVLETEVTENAVTTQGLEYIRLLDGAFSKVWNSGDAGSSKLVGYSFDVAGEQLVFTTEEKGIPQGSAIWYWKRGMDKAIVRITGQTAGIEQGMTIGSPNFSANGKWILFRLLPRVTDARKPNPDAVQVNIWNYKDVDLQPEQRRKLAAAPPTYGAVMNVDGGTVIQLEQPGKEANLDFGGNYAVVNNELISYKDGSSLLKSLPAGVSNFTLSPSGQFLVCYDNEKGDYLNYDLTTGKEYNISNVGLSKDHNGIFKGFINRGLTQVSGWVDDEAVLVCDNYDIWKLDLLGKKAAINVTNGYGFKHQIKLRLMYGPEGRVTHRKTVYYITDTLLITGFSSVTKNNGFYKKILGKNGDPEMLVEGSYTFYCTDSQIAGAYSFDLGMQPLKATNVSSWIIKRQTASVAPDFYLTNDFKTYKQLTDLQPQKKYNWLTTELINYKQLDGTPTQGILYKPENFDSTRKYPLVFNYYEKLSDRFNQFPKAEFTGTNINIPWFVSHGYLVFTPDIYYKMAVESNTTTGGWAYNSVVAATQYLAKRPYIDATRMGIQGHSFGGGETNYLVTHSHLFAAAAEAAGGSDPISGYLTLAPGTDGRGIEHLSKQGAFESGQSRYGATPWQRPDLYRKSSAVLNADKVTTPLLIMHNEFDNNIQWRQGIELYMALRRLGKKVWMLQYDNTGHGLSGINAVDYTIRLTQFFDYYLKGSQPSVWMTTGVPARLKGIETGYALDNSGKTP